MIPVPENTPRDAFPLAVEFVDRFLALDDDSPESDDDEFIRLSAAMFKAGGPMAGELCLGGILEVVLTLVGETLGRDPLSVWQETRQRLTGLGLAARSPR